MLSLPTPTPRDVAPPLKWGAIGTGIAGVFTNAVHQHTNQRVVAVTARDAEKTRAFAAKHDIARVHASVDGLLQDQEVDAVYVATPHILHRVHALAAIAAGKHVLVEKPIAMSAEEADEILSAGRTAGVLVMEAMWTRYLPQAGVISKVIADGLIGDIHLLTADFGFVSPYDPANRLWNAELGGGALLDAGVYPISFATSVLGAPSAVLAKGDLGPGGIDVKADVLLSYEGGARAIVSTSISTALPVRAVIAGSTGRIEVHGPFIAPGGLTVVSFAHGFEDRGDFIDDRFSSSHDGISDQAIAFATFVDRGLVESPVHSHAEVVSVMATIDAARAQVKGQ